MSPVTAQPDPPERRRRIGLVNVLRRIDPFLAPLLAAVGVATLVPARCAAAGVVDVATTVGIGLLFFLYGARLSTREALQGLMVCAAIAARLARRPEVPRKEPVRAL